jgi:carboxymethylenebutenolidase
VILQLVKLLAGDMHTFFANMFFFVADALEAKLHHLKEATIYRYPQQGHAFLNEDTWAIDKRKELGFVDKNIDPKADEKSVRDLAWSRITSFLITHLQ